MENLQNILVILGGIAALIFLVYYGFRVPWWKTLVGRLLFADGILFFVLYASGYVRIFLTHEELKAIIRLVITAFAVVIGYWRIYVLWRIRHYQRKADEQIQ